MTVNTAKELFLEELRDLYHAEKQATKALPRLAKAASSDELREALTRHLEETRGQVERLEEVFELLDVAKRGKRCEAMEGLVEESRHMIEEVEDEAVLDMALVSAAQKMEHYEIASYGTVVALAKAMGHEEAANLLAQTLEEEKRTDALLNEIAVNTVNPRALEAADAGDADAEDGEDEAEAPARARSGTGKGKGRTGGAASGRAKAAARS